MAAVAELANDVGTSAACQALCMPRASYYRDGRKISTPAVSSARPSPARALRPAERDAVLARLQEERFQDRSPAAVYATLLDEGVYHCSMRTMYRLLEEEGESGERRDQLTHPAYQKPELLATGSNQLWNWDVAEAFIGSDFADIKHYKEFEVSPQGEWIDLDVDLHHPHHEEGWRWNSGFEAAARIDPKRSGNSGRYFMVRNWLSEYGLSSET